MALRKRFMLLLAFQFALGVGLVVLSGALFLNQRQLSRSQAAQFDSYLLADELRQSSDDLTRLARTYAATGNAEYEREYWAVLAIRNGTLPRPTQYDRIYWDFVAVPGQSVRPDGEAVALTELMSRAGFTTAEFDVLATAQKNSNDLVHTEMIAMNAVKGIFADSEGQFTLKGKPDRALAIRILNDATYHADKAGIMRPIDEFYSMFQERTAQSVAIDERRAMHLLEALGVLVVLLMGSFGYSYVTVQRQIAQRERAEEEVRRLNTDLERRVEERTAELAAFSYSVAHDLRSPLRALDGFSQLLIRDYGDKLDDQGRAHLEHIRAAGQKMTTLIDGLLKLSRLSRGELRRERLDLSEIAREIAADLARAAPDRRVELVVAEGLTADADPRLGRLIFTNLLDNAWRFTARHETARVEVGSTLVDGERAFFVRDDGAGFDMAYVDKLFGAFQCLHPPGVFEGDGIGLAIVQRIVQRHGGRIWAEAEIEKGATFWFTLPSVLE